MTCEQCENPNLKGLHTCDDSTLAPGTYFSYPSYLDACRARDTSVSPKLLRVVHRRKLGDYVVALHAPRDGHVGRVQLTVEQRNAREEDRQRAEHAAKKNDLRALLAECLTVRADQGTVTVFFDGFEICSAEIK